MAKRTEGEGRIAIKGLADNLNNDRRIEFSFYKLSGGSFSRSRSRFREKCQSESFIGEEIERSQRVLSVPV